MAYQGKGGAGSSVKPDPIYIIITYGTFYVDGDERSRTNPGHGYPAHTVDTQSVTEYTDEDKWVQAIQYYTKIQKKFKAGTFYPAKITTEIKIND